MSHDKISLETGSRVRKTCNTENGQCPVFSGSDHLAAVLMVYWQYWGVKIALLHDTCVLASVRMWIWISTDWTGVEEEVQDATTCTLVHGLWIALSSDRFMSGSRKCRSPYDHRLGCFQGCRPSFKAETSAFWFGNCQSNNTNNEIKMTKIGKLPEVRYDGKASTASACRKPAAQYYSAAVDVLCVCGSNARCWWERKRQTLLL